MDIICVTETHLNSNILDSELSIDGFKFYRKDRDFDIHNSNNEISGGGGSIIYFKDTLNVNLLESFSIKAPDSLAIEVESNVGKFCVACVYRSPNLNSKLDNLLLSCIKNICKVNNDFETLVVGDFNLPDISWETCSLKNCGINTCNKIMLKQLNYMDTFSELGLKWSLITETTRRRLVKGVLQENLLDQVLSTNDALVSSVKLLSHLGKSDHVSLGIELGVSLSKPTASSPKKAIRKPTWSKVSVESLLEYSLNNVDWSYSGNNLSSEEMWEEVHDKLKGITDSVPVSRVDTNNRPLDLPWSNSALKRMRKRKDEAWNVFDMNPTMENFSYAQTRDQLYAEEEFRLKFNYEKKLTNNLKTNCKGFYSYLRNKRRLKTGVPKQETRQK